MPYLILIYSLLNQTIHIHKIKNKEMFNLDEQQQQGYLVLYYLLFFTAQKQFRCNKSLSFF